jgi:hypothetical protein
MPSAEKKQFSIDFPTSSFYNDYLDLHKKMENLISKQNKFNHLIIRAPEIVSGARIGAIYDLNIFPIEKAPKSPSAKKSQIGVLDLAECVVHSLILDVPRNSFMVTEDLTNVSSDDEEILLYPDDLSNSSLVPSISFSSNRPSRKAYYSILYMNEKEMQSSYIMKSPEAYEAQLSEDDVVEKYWEDMFNTLR